jgi:hypothetical protein
MTGTGSAGAKRVIFLHIPKTAGTTLRQIVRRQYPAESIFTFDETHRFDDFQRLRDAQKAEIRLLGGHMIFGLHRFMPGPSTYFTVLREPVERVISDYYFVRNTPVHHHYDFITSRNLSLEEFIESGEARIMTDNGQTRSLSDEWWNLPFGECTEKVLEQAKKNLREYFAVVGLIERFDETLLMLKRAFGWQNVYYARVNVNPSRPTKDELPQTTLDLIAEQNWLDLHLYEYAKELFEEQVQRQGSLFPLEVTGFRWANRCTNMVTTARQEVRRHSVRMWFRGWFQRPGT